MNNYLLTKESINANFRTLKNRSGVERIEILSPSFRDFMRDRYCRVATLSCINHSIRACNNGKFNRAKLIHYIDNAEVVYFAKVRPFEKNIIVNIINSNKPTWIKARKLKILLNRLKKKNVSYFKYY